MYFPREAGAALGNSKFRVKGPSEAAPWHSLGSYGQSSWNWVSPHLVLPHLGSTWTGMVCTQHWTSGVAHCGQEDGKALQENAGLSDGQDSLSLPGLFHLAKGPPYSSILSQMARFLSFLWLHHVPVCVCVCVCVYLWLNNIPLCTYIYISLLYLFIH